MSWSQKMLRAPSKLFFLSLQVKRYSRLVVFSDIQVEVLGLHVEDVEEVEVIRVDEVEDVLCTWCSLWPWGRFFHQVEIEEM